MTFPSTDPLTGLNTTPELVGRKDILEKFERILRDPSTTPHVVFLHGVGGIGKTRLLQKALQMARKCGLRHTADTVLDFYNISLHTPIGLAQAIFEALPPASGHFKAYVSAYSALNRARLSGNVVELKQLRDDAIEKFDQDLKGLSLTQRVVLVLDTAERIVYGLETWTDEIPFSDSWNWLVEHLPTWQNVIVFMAGRDEAMPAIAQLKRVGAALVEEIDEVKPFSLHESQQYFEAVERLFDENKEYQLAERLKNLPPAFKQGAYFYSRQGRPILLSLFVDYLSFPGEDEVENMLREKSDNNWDDEDYWRYEEALIRRFQETEKGKTLIALGRLPKGADEELLAAVLDISPTEARKRLREVRTFSVVKIRPEDNRVFLHDEMYVLLQNHVYDSLYDGEPQKKVFEAIKGYYKKQSERISGRLNELYAPVEEHGRESLDLKELGKTHTQYQALLTEIMYYNLRYDLGRGFRSYYRFSHEAIMARDVLMDLQLQAELLSYLSRPPAPILEKNVSVKMILEGLKTRPPARAWALGDYETGVNEAQDLIEKFKETWKREYPFLLAAVHAWAASLFILRGDKGDLQEGEKHFQCVFSLLDVNEVHKPFVDQSLPDTLLWYKKAIAALAYRVQGYLKRVEGLIPDSVAKYQQAAMLLRELDIRIEMATTMNDMGFAQAEMGEWHDGRANVRHALSLRRELGPRIPVALSLNTLAAIGVREGEAQYASARQNAEKALSIFRAFSHERGIAMALVTLAESTRRLSGAMPLSSDADRIKYLREARDYAREARDIFEKQGETSRQIEALIEVGTACRDWVYWLRQSPQPGDDLNRLLRESQETLRAAAQLAQSANLLHRRVDALVNLAWLEYYLLEKDETIPDGSDIVKAIQIAEETFPSEDEMQKQPQTFGQKGKLFVLKGHLVFRDFQQAPKELTKKMDEKIIKMLESMAENYAKALEFNKSFAMDYQGMRQAKNSIDVNLRLMNSAEMRIICNRIQKMYPDGSVIQSFLTNRALWQIG
ncbi:MAG: ATP-binding protein [Chloroflexi bacterium]|nr:ATP-binding protein [Chloroflexota bacterium]